MNSKVIYANENTLKKCATWYTWRRQKLAYARCTFWYLPIWSFTPKMQNSRSFEQ